MDKLLVRRLWLVFVCTTGLACLALNAYAQTVSTQEIQLTSSLDREHSPSLGRDGISDLVVFTRTVNTISQVFYQRYDKQGIFGPEVLVSDATGTDILSDVFGDHIVYSSYPELFSRIGQIKLYTISTGVTVVLTGPVEIRDSRIHGTKVVWVEGEIDAKFVKIADINAANPQASSVTISGPLVTAARASIGDRLVVWEHFFDFYSPQDLEAYDMSTSQYITIAADPARVEAYGTSSGSWVTWASAAEGASNSIIHTTNVDTGESRLIVDDRATNIFPNMDGDFIAWESNVAGNQDIYIYSLSYDAVWQLTNSSDDQYLNNIYDHAVAYIDKRHGNSDIFVTLFDIDPCGDHGGDQDGDGICDDDDQDGDNDGVLDSLDNCINVHNPLQGDNDIDGYGDACDDDDDNDGVNDIADNCQFVPNDDQSNVDGDSEGDACDGDADNDTIVNGIDNCPLAPNNGQENTDGDAMGDACDDDDDNDSIRDITDNCPTVSNLDQANLDGDSLGDVCDADDDGDGIDDVFDNCPIVPNYGQDDTDFDGTGDACDNDDDNDGIADTSDNCQLIGNADQTDSDNDGQGDICDDDLDGDGFANDADSCPNTANTSQNDFDGDGLGDVCDDDADNDGVANTSDLCADTPTGELADPSNGCSLVQLMPCGGPMGSSITWRNHGQYIALLNKTLKSFLEQGLIDTTEHGILISEAANSDCGQKN